MHPYVHCSIIRNGQEVEATQVPFTDEWINKMYICTAEHYSALRKHNIVPFAATWMELEGIIVSEINQTKINTA